MTIPAVSPPVVFPSNVILCTKRVDSNKYMVPHSAVFDKKVDDVMDDEEEERKLLVM